MEKKSCVNCHNLDRGKQEIKEGRLKGKYRYGCDMQRSGYICGFISEEEKLELLVCESWNGEIKSGVDNQKLAKNYGQQLQDMYDRWNLWREKGCPEAEVTDGVYLNRLRQGIMVVVKQIECDLEEEEYPDCYYSPLPPVMDEGFMADFQNISVVASQAKSEYTRSLDYQFLAAHIHELNNDDKENSEAYRLLCYPEIIDEAVQSEDWMRMKRVSRLGTLYADLAVCRKKIEKGRKKKLCSGRKSKKKGQQIIGQMDISGLKVS